MKICASCAWKCAKLSGKRFRRAASDALSDGKDRFTIIDFVKAHRPFSDPEGDGDPVGPGNPELCPTCGKTQCVCVKRVKVEHADGKARVLQHMQATTLGHPDGTPMTAHQFLRLLFGQLPAFFRDEDELRRLWSVPATRRKLLAGPAEKGFGRDQLAEMQRLIDAEKSDLFDVLAYVAYVRPPVPRSERAARARDSLGRRYSTKEQGVCRLPEAPVRRRCVNPSRSEASAEFASRMMDEEQWRNGGGRRIRTFEGVSRQIYSLMRLATSLSHR